MAYKVLVVDDDPSFLDLMQALLTGEGYEVATCRQSQAALHQVETFHPQVITLDLRMPEPSGWQVLETLKHDPATSDIPVIVVSAAGAELAETRERLRGYEGRGVSILVKPFEIDELLSRIADAVYQYQSRRGGRRTA